MKGRVDPWCEAVIPRSEPVLAPVVASARRLDRADAAGVARVGKTLELVLARPVDESLAEANTAVDAAAQPHGMGVSFWAEHPNFAWAARMGLGDHEGDALGDGLTPEPVALTLDAPGELAELDARVPDLWRGAVAYRTRDLPYFMRVHAVAYAAAGVVVSPTSVATFEEGEYKLALPSRSGAWDASTASTPRWDVDEVDDKVHLRFEIPLVRYVDGMTPEALVLWQHGEPALLRTPDPAVSYRVSLDVGGGVGVGASTAAELDIAPVTDPNDAALYRAQRVGPRLKGADAAAISAVKDGGGLTHRIDVELAIVGAAPEPLAPPFVTDAGLAGRFFGLRLRRDDAAALGTSGAQARVTLTVQRPPQIVGLPGGVTLYDWNELHAQVDAALAEIAEFLPAPAAGFGAALIPFEDVLRRARGVGSEAAWQAMLSDPALGGQQIDATTYQLTVETWPAGAVVHSRSLVDIDYGAWSWAEEAPLPSEGDRARRRAVEEALSRLEAILVTQAQASESRQLLTGAIRSALRARYAHSRRDGLHASFAPVAASLASGAQAMAFATASAEQGPAETWRIEWTLSVTPPLLIDGSVDKTRVDQLIEVLESLSTAAAAVEIVGSWEDGLAGKQPVSLPIPGRDRVATMAAINQALAVANPANQQDAPVQLEDAPSVVVQLRPPKADDIAALAGADPMLVIEFLSRIATDQLFGPGREPSLWAFHGLARPVRELFERGSNP